MALYQQRESRDTKGEICERGPRRAILLDETGRGEEGEKRERKEKRLEVHSRGPRRRAQSSELTEANGYNWGYS